MLSILIVNWNTRDLLRACLFSLENLGVESEIIVVDNDSSDQSAAMVAREFPDVKLLALTENLGFAEGNNRALEMATGDWVWLLNPDTQVLPGAAAILMNFLKENEGAAAVASALIDARDGSFQRSCRTFPTPGALWCEALLLSKFFRRSRRFGFYKMGDFNHKTRRCVEQPMASSFLLRRSAIESIGGLFDVRFPIFFNDVDLCFRLVKNGWEIWYEPAAKVKHWGGAATSQRRPQMIAESHRSLRAFYQKWWRREFSSLIWFGTLALIEISGRLRVWNARRAQKKAAK